MEDNLKILKVEYWLDYSQVLNIILGDHIVCFLWTIHSMSVALLSPACFNVFCPHNYDMLLCPWNFVRTWREDPIDMSGILKIKLKEIFILFLWYNAFDFHQFNP